VVGLRNAVRAGAPSGPGDTGGTRAPDTAVAIPGWDAPPRHSIPSRPPPTKKAPPKRGP